MVAAGHDTSTEGTTRVRHGASRIASTLTNGGLTWVYGAALIVTALSLTPLLFVAWAVVEAGLTTSAALILRPRVAELLINTILLVTLSTPLCIVLATALAWLTARTDLPGARLFTWLHIAPLTIPAFVHGYGWVSVAPSFHGLGAATLLSVLAYYPFLYMPIAATLRRLDPALEDTASSLGLKPWNVFQRVVLPQLRLPILGGGLLFGLHILAEYGLYALLRTDTFTTAIVDQFQSTFNGPAANMLAAVLLILAICIVAPEARLRGSIRFARVGAGAARPAYRHPLSIFTLPALVLSVATCAMSLGVPMLTILSWLSVSTPDAAKLWQFLDALGQSAILAAVGAIATAMAAVPIAWLAVRKPDRFGRLLEGANYMVGSLPGIVVSLALVFITVRVANPLYQTTFTLLLAYLVMFLPRALVSLRAGIAQVPVGIEEAAMSLGRTQLQAVLAVTLRVALPGALTALALTALGISNELTATLLLAPDGARTLATQFWALSSELDYAAAAPYALMMVLLSMPMTAFLHERWLAQGG